MKLFVTLTLLVCCAHALTVEEAKKFHSSGTYGGAVRYTDNGDTITITSNGLPDHPFESVNPNHPASRSDVYTVPKNSQIGTTPGCLSMGPIGMAVTGSMIFNPMNAEGQNAVEGAGKERFDHYGGHTDQHGIYHYHQIPGSWLYTGEADELLGVAFDGFPIYGPMASDLGREVTNNDLDQCHGRMVNGHYRYHANTEFPYYLGCYKGATVDKARTQYGTCTSTSALPEYGYICACAHSGPGTMNHQPDANQQHQPDTSQQQSGIHQPDTSQHQPDTSQHQPDTSQHQPDTSQHQHLHPFPPDPEHHHMRPPHDGYPFGHLGPHNFDHLVGKKK